MPVASRAQQNGFSMQRDDDDTPTDGYGGNSSRFIEAYLGMDER